MDNPRHAVLHTPKGNLVPKLKPNASMSTSRSVYEVKVYDDISNRMITGLDLLHQQQYFLSSDATSVQLHSFETTKPAFRLLELDGSSGFVTSLAASRRDGHLFAYSTNVGSICLCDTRVNSRCNTPVLAFRGEDYVMDVCFAHNSDWLLGARELNQALLLDMRASAGLPRAWHVSPQIEESVADQLVTMDPIASAFRIRFSRNDQFLTTGTKDLAVNFLSLHDATEDYGLTLSQAMNLTDYLPQWPVQTTLADSVTESEETTIEMCVRLLDTTPGDNIMAAGNYLGLHFLHSL